MIGLADDVLIQAWKKIQVPLPSFVDKITPLHSPHPQDIVDKQQNDDEMKSSVDQYQPPQLQTNRTLKFDQ